MIEAVEREGNCRLREGMDADVGVLRRRRFGIISVWRSSCRPPESEGPPNARYLSPSLSRPLSKSQRHPPTRNSRWEKSSLRPLIFVVGCLLGRHHYYVRWSVHFVLLLVVILR